MPQTTVEIRTLSDSSLAVGSSGQRTLTIDRSKEAVVTASVSTAASYF
jgi:hypothetical protein